MKHKSVTEALLKQATRTAAEDTVTRPAPRSVKFQMLMTEATKRKLQYVANEKGISMNELINQILNTELNKIM